MGMRVCSSMRCRPFRLPVCRRPCSWWAPRAGGLDSGGTRHRLSSRLRPSLAAHEAAIMGGERRAELPASHRPAHWDAVRAAVHAGVTIGAHSVTHRSLPTLSDTELDFEVVTSRTMIERATGTRPEFFAYPYGLWDYRVRSRVRLAGYRAALTLRAGLNRPFADPCSLRRLNVPAGISRPAFEAWAAGFTIGQS